MSVGKPKWGTCAGCRWFDSTPANSEFYSEYDSCETWHWKGNDDADE